MWLSWWGRGPNRSTQGMGYFPSQGEVRLKVVPIPLLQTSCPSWRRALEFGTKGTTGLLRSRVKVTCLCFREASAFSGSGLGGKAFMLRSDQKLFYIYPHYTIKIIVRKIKILHFRRNYCWLSILPHVYAPTPSPGPTLEGSGCWWGISGLVSWALFHPVTFRSLLGQMTSKYGKFKCTHLQEPLSGYPQISV